MAELSNTIEDIISKGLVQFLLAEGFNRTDKTFVKYSNNAIQLLCVEESKSGFGSSNKFTICLGLYFPSLAKKAGMVATSGIPRETECHVRERIGFLMPKKKDHWWMVIKPVIDLDGLGVEVRDTVAKYGLAWFDHYMLLDAENLLASGLSNETGSALLH